MLKNDGVKHFTNAEPVLLSEAIEIELGITYEKFKSLLKLGAVYVNNYRQNRDRWILQPDSVFRVHSEPSFSRQWRRGCNDSNWPGD